MNNKRNPYSLRRSSDEQRTISSSLFKTHQINNYRYHHKRQQQRAFQHRNNNNRIIETSLKSIILLLLLAITYTTTTIILPNLLHLSSSSSLYPPIYTPSTTSILHHLTSELPPTFPQSLTNTNTPFPDLPHPADPTITLSVPPFLTPPRRLTPEGLLMTPLVTHTLGSYQTPNGRMGDVISERTIFVMIPSYREGAACQDTVESVFGRAGYPERIRVGVVDQYNEMMDVSCGVSRRRCEEDESQALCQYRERIDVYEMESTLAIGAVFARHVLHRMYRGEYYILQIDAHVTLVQDWDINLISQLQNTGNEMAILSTLLPEKKFSQKNNNPENDDDDNNPENDHHHGRILCRASFDGPSSTLHLYHNQPSLPTSQQFTTPLLQPYWSAGFSFARGHFVMNVPYDPHLPMIGGASSLGSEDVSITLRAFSLGYDFYAPVGVLGWRKERREVKEMFWEHAKLYKGFEKKSMGRLLGLLQMNPSVDPSTWNHDEEDVYGLGHVRDVSKFFMTFGVHVQVKRTENKLCDFVSLGKMHDLFQPALRDDGMGIDYDLINFRYHELHQ